MSFLIYLLALLLLPSASLGASSGKPFSLSRLTSSSSSLRGGASTAVPPPTAATTSTTLNTKPINFHKHKPPLPNATASLADLETSASDELIAQTIAQVTLDSQFSSQIILKYKPEPKWLWKRWHGTILQSSLKKVGINAALTAVLSLALRSLCGTSASWGWGMEPSADCLVVAKLKVVDKLWHYQMQLTTFILTFFLTQAYQMWREMYKVGRGIQGRLSDVGVLLATHAARDATTCQYTEAAKEFLRTTARQLRMFHILTWAASSRQFQVLLTTRGLTQLMQHGFLTASELETLLQLPLTPGQRANAVIEWLILECNQARQEGVLVSDTSFPKLLLQKICDLRGTAASIGDLVDGRMPLAYAHLVQLLVDSFLFFAPLALFSELGVWSVVCVAFMTLFYEGLLDLAKIFLDPLNSEDYCEGGVDMDLGVFIRESNAGSLKWMNGLAMLPKDHMMMASTGTASASGGQTASQSTSEI